VCVQQRREVTIGSLQLLELLTPKPRQELTPMTDNQRQWRSEVGAFINSINRQHQPPAHVPTRQAALAPGGPMIDVDVSFLDSEGSFATMDTVHVVEPSISTADYSGAMINLTVADDYSNGGFEVHIGPSGFDTSWRR